MVPEIPPLPDRCSWDDGFTDPPIPLEIGQNDRFCRDAVIDVFYNFTWKGQEIVRLNATVILGESATNECSHLVVLNASSYEYLQPTFQWKSR